ncbi:deazapurine DNA modification protein DpdA family protein [Asanoa siamensis]|uniref:DeoxyPurine in DNA protein A domain-containing protein n=1 Tax=Asanoa siamensis TaxID=926357 RepID=A0ABQ4CSB6_9ACTN|nr:hypothetical protein [Asanoa siamensis]GIF74151.1 hypothetical protein Asi02nite_36690 [Asanoa siamensis]
MIVKDLDAIRRRTIAAYGVDPQRAARLLELMRRRGVTEWPPPPTVEQRRARWDAHVARYGLGPDRWHTQWGPVTPYTRSEFHPDPARRMTFYLGVGHPHHLRHSPVPLFISATTLARYVSRYEQQGDDWPVQTFGTPWAGDSGAYAALMLNTRGRRDHPWYLWPADYGAMWVRFAEAVGHSSRDLMPDFVGVQDWPCEPAVLKRTGKTVREHQELTVESYLYLAEEFPMIDWLPTLQGWWPWEYVEHVEMYQRAGVDLTGRRVGVGSICRRGSQKGVARVLGTLTELGLGLDMHGFGISQNALRIAGHLLNSADSQAWSKTARDEHLMLPGCNHLSRPDAVTGVRRPTDCRNCFAYALHWREEALDAVRACARDRTNGQHPAEPVHLAPALLRRAHRSRLNPDQLLLFGQ